jgi:hypothetical protein
MGRLPSLEGSPPFHGLARLAERLRGLAPLGDGAPLGSWREQLAEQVEHPAAVGLIQQAQPAHQPLLVDDPDLIQRDLAVAVLEARSQLPRVSVRGAATMGIWSLLCPLLTDDPFRLRLPV